MQATRGSRDDSPAPSEGEEVISPEQLRFTAAISKAMSKELAPLLAGRDPTQARPSVYRGSKEGPKVFELLASRFGTGGNRLQVRQALTTRQQSEREDWMQYLDALEGLRSQGLLDESVTTKRYEIRIDGVRDPILRRE